MRIKNSLRVGWVGKGVWQTDETVVDRCGTGDEGLDKAHGPTNQNGGKKARCSYPQKSKYPLKWEEEPKVLS